MFLLTSTVQYGLGIVLSVLAILFAGRLAGRLCQSRHMAAEADSTAVSLRPQAWMGLAVLIGTVYVLANYLRYASALSYSSTYSFGRALDFGRFQSLVSTLISPPLLAIILGLLVAIFGPRLAARAHPVESRQPPGEGKGGLIALEVAITLCALYYGMAYVFRSLWLEGVVSARHVSLWQRLRLGVSLPVLLALGALVFRSDIAWLLYRRWRGNEEVSSPRRAQVLQPWIVLLGAVCLVVALPGAVALAVGIWHSDTEWMSWPSSSLPRAAAGLLLLFASGWVSRRLSHGRLVPRIVSAFHIRRNEDQNGQ